MLKISIVDTPAQCRIVLEGKLIAPWVTELKKTWEALAADSPLATRPASAARSIFVAKQKKRDASQAKVTCAVTIGGREAGGFGISVKMRVEERALDRPSSPRSCGKHTRKSAPTRMRRVATWRSCSMWSAVEDAAAAFEPAGMHAAHEVNGHASRTPSRSPSSSWRCCRPDSVA